MKSIARSFSTQKSSVFAIIAIEILIGLGSYLLIPNILD
jgi:hypothetical protein